MAGALHHTIIDSAQESAKKGIGSLSSHWGGLSKSQKYMAGSVGASLAFNMVLDRDSPMSTKIGRAIIDSAVVAVMGPWGYAAARGGVPLARAVGTGVPIAWRAKKAQWNQLHKPNLGGNYQDTQQAATMRQAAVQAIQGSRLNARNALGNEASLMHRR